MKNRVLLVKLDRNIMYNTNMQDKILQRWNNHFRIVKTHT